MHDLAPFTGFGDDTNSSVKFGILIGNDGQVPNWSGGARINRFAVPHSDRTITQYGGRDPWVVSFRCWFATIADMELMDQLQGTRHTLRYRSGMTKTVGGIVATIGDTTYLVLPDTMLDRISDESYEVDGDCEATLTFSRAGASSAYYGFALYGEDPE